MSSIVGQAACSPTEKQPGIVTVCIDSSPGKLFVDLMNPIEAVFMLPGSMYIASKPMDRDDIRIVCYG
jgi:hypothetical protein